MKNIQDLSVIDYYRIIRRRIWYLIVTAALVSIGTTIYVMRMPSLYRSETTIMVSSRLLPEDYIGSMIRESAGERIDFVRQQLRSRSFVERMVQEFQLGNAQQTNTQGLVNTVLNNTEITSISLTTFKVAYTSTTPEQAQSITRRLAEKVLQLNDTVRKEKVYSADQFLDEQVRLAANDLAAAEEKVRLFDRQNFPSLPDDQVVGLEGISALERQLATVTADLENQTNQRRLLSRRLDEQQQLKTVLRNPGPSVPVEAQTIPQELQPEPTQLERALVSKRAELMAAVSRYTPMHPDVGRLTREVRDLETQVANQIRRPAEPRTVVNTPGEPAKIPAVVPLDPADDLMLAEIQIELEQLGRDIVKNQQTKDFLSQRVDLFKRRLNLPAGLAQQMNDLKRDLETSKQRYQYLSGKKVTSELAGSVDTSDSNALFKIIDPANLPQRAIWPDRQTYLAIGYLLSIGLGLGLAFIRELMDPTFADEDEFSAQFKLPVLASIPQIVKPSSKKAAVIRKPVLTVIPPSSVPGDGRPVFSLQAADSNLKAVILESMTMGAEQFRLARAGIKAIRKQHGLKCLLIASAIPNEGKTFTAACLAGILAQEGDNGVLLIDADLRTSQGMHLLGLDEKKPFIGLSDVVSGSADLDSAVLKCAEMNLYFLPSGTTVNNPTEVLSLPQFENLIRDVSQRFDWVIIDSPPTLALADASHLISVCDAALMVVRAEKTPRNLVKDSIDRIGEDNICGVLLNGVRTIKSTHYYKDYYQQVSPMKKK